MSNLPALRLDHAEVAAFLDQAFPEKARPALGELVAIAPGHARLRLHPDADMIRPGGIVSGPVLMGLVDVAAYAVILSHVGPVAMAVTNMLTISFLRACRLATVDVRLWQEAEDRLVAQATVGYALP